MLDPTLILNPVQAHQLDGLLKMVHQLTGDSISGWHQSLAEEVHSATNRIERLMISNSQQTLTQELVQTFSQRQQVILNTLVPPLKALEKLVLSGHLNDASKAKLLIQLGRTYELLTQWDLAIDQFYQALDYCKDDLVEKATVLKSIGRIKSKQRDFGEAHKQYQASLAIYQELEDSYQVAQLYINIGFNHFQSDNYSAAEENYNKALLLAQSTADAERLVADVSMNLGILATVKGDQNSALSHYEQSIEVYTEIDDERGLSHAYHNMAMLCVDFKLWQKAGTFYQKSLEYARRLTNLHLMGHVYLNYTELALKLSDLELAQACCMHAIKTFGRIGAQAQLGDALKFAGITQHRKKNFDKADLFFRRSIQMAVECESKLNQAEAQYEYALHLLEKQKPDKTKAENQLNEAMKIFTELDAKADIANTQAALDRIAESQKAAAPTSRFIRINRDMV